MKGDGRDPRPLLAIVAVLALMAIDRAVSSIRIDHLLASAASLAPLALGALAIAAALAPQRFYATRRALAARVTVAVVPADEFDPKPETVLRFAAEVARADRSLRGWLDRRAHAVRVQLTNDREGQLVYLLEVPARSREALRTALRDYEGAELRDVAEVLPDAERPGAAVRLRTELVLAKASVEPLRRLDLDPDPLQPFAAAMASLRAGRGERATVCVDLLPSAGRRDSRLRRRLKREARRAHGQRRSLMEILDNERKRGPADPAELFERRMVGQALDAKLRDAGPLFEAQILLCCEAAERPRAKQAMHGLLAAFAPFSSGNYLRAAGLPVGDAVFFGADNPLRRRGFDRRLATGLHRPARRQVLTAREVAGFLKPPNAHCVTENVVRSGTLLPAPPALPRFSEGDREVIPLGHISGESGRQLVGARTADTFFTYIAGRSRYGKTETAIAQFVHLVRCGHGGLFLDPHGDALERIRPYLAESRIGRRVIEIDVGGGDWSLPGWNLFELRGAGTAAVEGRVEAVVDAFASTMRWSEQSTRAINLTTQAAGALAHAARVLPPELSPTIFQLPTLLSDERWREAVLPFLPKASQRFWVDRFPLLAEEAITPLTNLVDRLRGSTPMTALLGQSASTYRVREAMDEGWIVLAHPGSGGTRERLLANLLLFDLLHAAKGRAEIRSEERKPFWVFLDEVQTYDGVASGNLAALLEQSAKFGLRAVVLNQNPERLNPQTLNALTTNRSHLLTSALNSHAAALLTKEWGRRISPEAVTQLDRYRFIAQVTDRGKLSKPFALEGIRVEDVAELREALAGEPGEGAVTRAEAGEVIEHLETLDERILAALRKLRKEGSEASSDASGEPSSEPSEKPQRSFFVPGGDGQG
ncbi:MAG TPA: hypothetical protein VG448_11635 [Solirubrobacterales bacterium]|nr:hypothetical protein [Solirubrobacterales bacterium]